MSPSNAIPTARAWADVDLGALVANARTVLSVSGSRLLPMVKANAYGTGAVAVARALDAVDPWGYGVVTLEEGIELRRAGIERPIVVFGAMGAAAAGQYLDQRLRPAIGDLPTLRTWLESGGHPFHLEIDTGMNRLGFSWRERDGLAEAGRLLADAEGWEGVFTHFHSADDDLAATRLQWDRFTAALGGLPRRPPLVHAASSAAALRGGEFAGDLVRPGIFLYGGEAGAIPPEPVVRLRAAVVGVRRVARGDSVSYGAGWRAERDTRVATIAIGYADGVPRSLGGRGEFELLGRRVPIVGKVTMDFTMVDIGELEVPPGTVATVFGGMVSLDAQAAAAGRISYELLTGLGPRVERRYGEEG